MPHQGPTGSRARPLPSGLVTFLFTDIEGSTRLFRALGDAYVALLDRHHELLRGAWDRHHGVEVKTEGDAFFVAFADPGDAVEAAVSAQQAIAAEPWETADPLRVRIGIHSGIAAPRDGDYIAYAVHQAARVVGAAHGGQIIVTGDTVRAARATQVDLVPVGEFRLRDFDHPVDLFRVIAPGVEDDPRPPRATPAMGHNLVEPATSFVGRAADLDQLASRVRAGTLVTIVGPGGAGKTRLATELGLRIAPEWRDGVWLVEFAPVGPSGAGLAGVLAESLSIAAGNRDPLDAVVEDYAGRQAIVILDNCEHVVGAAALLADAILRRLPSLAVLATSREPLGIAREQTWRVGPLSSDHDAVELFIARAYDDQTARPGPSDLATIRRLCERLDGNPLGIELAAARLAEVGLAGLQSSLDDRFRILRSRRRDLDPRQRSMTAVLDWSHGLLEDGEQAAFRRLAAFRSAFVLDAAEVAASGPDLDLGATIDAVWALVDKSLLAVDGSDSQTRFTMSETVRSYALDRLRSAQEAGDVFRRLGDWYASRFGPWVALDTTGVGDLRVELDNIRGIIDALAESSQEAAQGLAVAVAYFLDVSGQPVEGVAEVDALLQRLPEMTPMRAMLLVGAARLRHRLGHDDLDPLLDEAQRVLETAGPEPEWAAGSLATMRALALAARGESDAALAIADALTVEGAPLVAMARGWNAIGIIKGNAGDAAGALEAHRRSLAVEERLGRPVEIAVAHNNVAEYALRLDLTAEAAAHQLATLELAAEIGSTVLIAFSLVIAARIAATQQRWREAVHLHGAADRWLQESGYALAESDAELSAALLRTAREHLGAGYQPVVDAGQSAPIDEAVEAARMALRSAAT